MLCPRGKGNKESVVPEARDSTSRLLKSQEETENTVIAPANPSSAGMTGMCGDARRVKLRVLGPLG